MIDELTGMYPNKKGNFGLNVAIYESRFTPDENTVFVGSFDMQHYDVVVNMLELPENVDIAKFKSHLLIRANENSEDFVSIISEKNGMVIPDIEVSLKIEKAKLRKNNRFHKKN
eukprot:TRINITY_DN2094_c0_g2_i2.p1 TRINITY_DN2094_c0_g2~~TRINITY_DN2094_c0_g2_i2.p1  ORF type:complete len:114 (+),score=37.69 TRINITY_DN2094_c0_g2_i2:213-554(+)